MHGARPGSRWDDGIVSATAPTPREFAAVSVAAEAARPLTTPPVLDPRAGERAHGSLEAEVRLLAMRVAILVRRVEELSTENESIRNEMSALVRKTRPSAPYSSVAPTSEVVRIPESKRPDSKRPLSK